MRIHQSVHQTRINEMMRKAEQELPETPTIPSTAVLHLRSLLILEEARELIKAMGFDIGFNKKTKDIEIVKVESGIDVEPNLIEIADGCADLSVVNIGTLSACGIQDIPLLQEVDYNNLEKFAGDGHKNEHGKWIKPTNHQPPDIAKVLKAQGWQG